MRDVASTTLSAKLEQRATSSFRENTAVALVKTKRPLISLDDAAGLCMVRIEIPALHASMQALYNVKPGREKHVMHGVTEMFESLREDFGEDLVHVDQTGVMAEWEQLQSQAIQDFRKWSNEIKEVEEWKVKVDRAEEKIRKMRDAYLKDVVNLREQVYQQSIRDDFKPTYAVNFDACEYTVDERESRVFQEKIRMIQMELQQKVDVREEEYRKRIRVNEESLITLRDIVNRKDCLIEKMKKRLVEERPLLSSYTDAPIEEKSESDVEIEPATEAAVFGSTTDVQQSTESKDGDACPSPQDDDVSSCHSGNTDVTSNAGSLWTEQQGLKGKILRAYRRGKSVSAMFAKRNYRSTRPALATIGVQTQGEVKLILPTTEMATETPAAKDLNPKVKRCSRAVQSHLEARLIEKAEEYFEELNQGRWEEMMSAVDRQATADHMHGRLDTVESFDDQPQPRLCTRSNSQRSNCQSTSAPSSPRRGFSATDVSNDTKTGSRDTSDAAVQCKLEWHTNTGRPDQDSPHGLSRLDAGNDASSGEEHLNDRDEEHYWQSRQQQKFLRQLQGQSAENMDPNLKRRGMRAATTIGVRDDKADLPDRRLLSPPRLPCLPARNCPAVDRGRRRRATANLAHMQTAVASVVHGSESTQQPACEQDEPDGGEITIARGHPAMATGQHSRGSVQGVLNILQRHGVRADGGCNPGDGTVVRRCMSPNLQDDDELDDILKQTVAKKVEGTCNPPETTIEQRIKRLATDSKLDDEEVDTILKQTVGKKVESVCNPPETILERRTKRFQTDSKLMNRAASSLAMRHESVASTRAPDRSVAPTPESNPGLRHAGGLQAAADEDLAVPLKVLPWRSRSRAGTSMGRMRLSSPGSQSDEDAPDFPDCRTHQSTAQRRDDHARQPILPRGDRPVVESRTPKLHNVQLDMLDAHLPSETPPSAAPVAMPEVGILPATRRREKSVMSGDNDELVQDDAVTPRTRCSIMSFDGPKDKSSNATAAKTQRQTPVRRHTLVHGSNMSCVVNAANLRAQAALLTQRRSLQGNTVRSASNSVGI